MVRQGGGGYGRPHARLSGVPAYGAGSQRRDGFVPGEVPAGTSALFEASGGDDAAVRHRGQERADCGRRAANRPWWRDITVHRSPDDSLAGSDDDVLCRRTGVVQRGRVR